MKKKKNEFNSPSSLVSSKRRGSLNGTNNSLNNSCEPATRLRSSYVGHKKSPSHKSPSSSEKHSKLERSRRPSSRRVGKKCIVKQDIDFNLRLIKNKYTKKKNPTNKRTKKKS
eukprot:113753_1